MAELMMFKLAESGHPVFRATSPLSRGQLKSKGGAKLSIHYCADLETIETVFRTITSVNQLSIHGAVSVLCEEYQACHVRTWRLVVVGQSDPLFVPTSSLMKTPTPSTDDPAQEDLLQKYRERVERLSHQLLESAVKNMNPFMIERGNPVVKGQSSSSFVPSVIKTHMPLNDDDPAHKEFQLQRYGERIEKLSQQDRLSKFCMDAGFLTTVEVGQNFMTKDTEEFSQFTDSVACREYTLPRDEDLHEPKGWIRGNTKIGPVLEVTTCCLQGKYGVEIRIMSMNEDKSHSWVRISHGLNKLVANMNKKDQDNNEQETSEMQFEDFALKTNVLAFASRSKAKAKPQRRTPACSSARTVPIGERNWTDIEQEDYSPIAYPVSKQLSTLLRHGHLPQEENGAIVFWRLKDYLWNDVVQSQH